MSTPAFATYRTMPEGTAEDYALISRAEEANNAGLVPRVLSLVEALADGEQAYPISRLDHSLQSAARAFDDGRSVDYVVAALLHDIGDTYAPHAHGAFAAAVLAPNVFGTRGLDRQGQSKFQQYYSALTWVVCEPARGIAATRGSTIASSSARSTTRTASIRDSSIVRSSSSTRWSSRSSLAHRGPSRTDPARGGSATADQAVPSASTKRTS